MFTLNSKLKQLQSAFSGDMSQRHIILPGVREVSSAGIILKAGSYITLKNPSGRDAVKKKFMLCIVILACNGTKVKFICGEVKINK